MNYFSKYSPATSEMHMSLGRLISKCEWTWNKIYQKLYNKAKALNKEDACMKIYNQKNPILRNRYKWDTP